MSGSNLCVGGLWVGLIPGVARRDQGPSLPRSRMFKFKIITWGGCPVTSDQRTLHPGAMSAVWEIFCSESSQTRKIFLSCRNIKRILIWYLVKYKVSVWFLCMQIWPYFLTQSLVAGNREAQQTVRGQQTRRNQNIQASNRLVSDYNNDGIIPSPPNGFHSDSIRISHYSNISKSHIKTRDVSATCLKWFSRWEISSELSVSSCKQLCETNEIPILM